RLTGKTLGIYAYGGIGNIVAKVGAAFGMNILAWGREGSRERAEADGFKMAASREAFFETSDVVSIHIPLLPDARGIITAGDLGRMKPSALFVNTSRAGLVEEGALEAALKAGRPGSAAVDVYEDEPVLNGNHPLLKLDNCLCSPHLGYVSNESMEQYVGGAFDRVVAFAEGNPIDVINPEVLK
ncbi:MAG: D-2-hydroxyacid dehydrogenase family protein, partial [Nitrospinaceae bacterium]|nr:D-2-hydroxyacid dehydrogenase family protein [Nitrospinaceae bacterium]